MESNSRHSTLIMPSGGAAMGVTIHCRKLGAFGIARCLRIISQLSQRIDLTPLVEAVQSMKKPSDGTDGDAAAMEPSTESIKDLTKLLLDLLAPETLSDVKAILREITALDEKGIEALSPNELVEILRYSWELNQLEREFELVKKTLNPLLEAGGSVAAGTSQNTNS